MTVQLCLEQKLCCTQQSTYLVSVGPQVWLSGRDCCQILLDPNNKIIWLLYDSPILSSLGNLKSSCIDKQMIFLIQFGMNRHPYIFRANRSSIFFLVLKIYWGLFTSNLFVFFYIISSIHQYILLYGWVSDTRDGSQIREPQSSNVKPFLPILTIDIVAYAFTLLWDNVPFSKKLYNLTISRNLLGLGLNQA